MIYFKRFAILFLILFLYSCSANIYYLNSINNEQSFEINKDKKIAIPSFTSVESEIGSLTSGMFISQIDTSLHQFLIEPSLVDSILNINEIYSLPNEPSPELINKLSKILDTEYILIGYIQKWNSADLGQDGEVKHKIDVYNLKLNKLVWSVTNSIIISAPESDESIYFIGTIESAYNKLISKTLDEISLNSNIKKNENRN
ncbi:hypothetical protein [Chondrinema litorale]|uniref:hypothetical protein n=1 Tax=Chondrinema litorale TaxID=2994555 RepID=UPI002543C347|nr:hypothetical protein [Chondrinema litorale]UZR97714.1 hypothetical protein OQ292_28325 [Chondrinema litorale]